MRASQIRTVLLLNKSKSAKFGNNKKESSRLFYVPVHSQDFATWWKCGNLKRIISYVVWLLCLSLCGELIVSYIPLLLHKNNTVTIVITIHFTVYLDKLSFPLRERPLPSIYIDLVGCSSTYSNTAFRRLKMHVDFLFYNYCHLHHYTHILRSMYTHHHMCVLCIIIFTNFFKFKLLLTVLFSIYLLRSHSRL